VLPQIKVLQKLHRLGAVFLCATYSLPLGRTFGCPWCSCSSLGIKSYQIDLLSTPVSTNLPMNGKSAVLAKALLKRKCGDSSRTTPVCTSHRDDLFYFVGESRHGRKQDDRSMLTLFCFPTFQVWDKPQERARKQSTNQARPLQILFRPINPGPSLVLEGGYKLYPSSKNAARGAHST